MRLRTLTLTHDTDKARKLRAANDPPGGVVVLGVAPEMRRTLPLAQDLLVALGCRDDIAGSGRDASRDLELAACWLAAHPVRHLVVVDAQWLHPDLLAQLVELVAIADVDTWLVCHEPVESRFRNALATWPTQPAGEAELSRAIRPKRPGKRAAPQPVFPRIVDAAWPTFLAECRAALPSAEHAVVKDRFDAALAAALDAFATAVDENLVFAHLQQRCAACATFDELVVEARAVQVAAWWSDWLVQLDVAQFAAVARTLPTAKQLANPELWQRLAAYPETWRGAACALASTGAGCTAITEFRLHDVNADGTTTAAPAALPAAAAVYLRAQRLHRLAAGAQAEDPLFADDRDAPMHDRRIAQALLDAQLECGLNLTGGRAARGSLDAATWASRLGISVQPLNPRSPA